MAGANEQGGKAYRILVINPGSTSTKVAVYEDEEPLVQETIRYDEAVLAQFETFFDSKDLRRADILDVLARHGIVPESLDAVVGRGGLVKPIASGTYEVSEEMVDDIEGGRYGAHACGLGAIIARDLGLEWGIPAYTVDPVVVDELEPVARVTGIPGIARRCSWHPLNQKAIARRYAKEQGTTYEALNLVVCHMGGGLTVGAHRHGRVIDVNNGIEGEGPMSPERCGGVPLDGVIRMCYSGEHTQDEMIKLQNGTGGIKAYLGTSDMREVEAMIDAGNEEAALLLDAMAYQVAKEVGAMATVLEGEVDAILLSGGLAYSERFVAAITHRVERLAPVHVYPGEDELLALAQGALRVLRGEEQVKTYA